MTSLQTKKERMTRELLYIVHRFLIENSCTESARMFECEGGLFVDKQHISDLVEQERWNEIEEYLSRFFTRKGISMRDDASVETSRIVYLIRKAAFLDAASRADVPGTSAAFRSLVSVQIPQERLAKLVNVFAHFTSHPPPPAVARAREPMSKVKVAQKIVTAVLAHSFLGKISEVPDVPANRLRELVNCSIQFQNARSPGVVETLLRDKATAAAATTTTPSSSFLSPAAPTTTATVVIPQQPSTPLQAQIPLRTTIPAMAAAPQNQPSQPQSTQQQGVKRSTSESSPAQPTARMVTESSDQDVTMEDASSKPQQQKELTEPAPKKKPPAEDFIPVPPLPGAKSASQQPPQPTLPPPGAPQQQQLIVAKMPSKGAGHSTPLEQEHVSVVCFHPTKPNIVAIGGVQGTYGLFDVSSPVAPKAVYTSKMAGEITILRWSPSGGSFAAASLPGSVNVHHYSPDTTPPVVKLISIVDGKILILDVLFLDYPSYPKGIFLVAAEDKTISVFAGDSGRLLGPLQNPRTSIPLSLAPGPLENGFPTVFATVDEKVLRKWTISPELASVPPVIVDCAPQHKLCSMLSIGGSLIAMSSTPSSIVRIDPVAGKVVGSYSGWENKTNTKIPRIEPVGQFHFAIIDGSGIRYFKIDVPVTIEKIELQNREVRHFGCNCDGSLAAVVARTSRYIVWLVPPKQAPSPAVATAVTPAKATPSQVQAATPTAPPASTPVQPSTSAAQASALVPTPAPTVVTAAEADIPVYVTSGVSSREATDGQPISGIWMSCQGGFMFILVADGTLRSFKFAGTGPASFPQQVSKFLVREGDETDSVVAISKTDLIYDQSEASYGKACYAFGQTAKIFDALKGTGIPSFGAKPTIISAASIGLAKPKCLAFHPITNGIIGAGHADGTVVLRVKQSTLTCEVSKKPIVSIAFSLLGISGPVGSRIAAIDETCGVFLIDSTPKKLYEVTELPIPSGHALGIKWHPTMPFLLFANTKGFVLFEFKDNKLQVQGFWRASPSSTVVSAFFDRDGEGLYCATQRDIFVFRGNFIGELHPVGKLQPLNFLQSREDSITAAESSNRTSAEMIIGTSSGVAGIIYYTV